MFAYTHKRCLVTLLRRCHAVRVLPCMALLLVGLTACVSTEPIASKDKVINTVLDYQTVLPDNHPDSVEKIFQVSAAIKAQVKERIKTKSQTRAAVELANWLIDPDGHGMVYDLDSNYQPQQAFERRTANCLSFTLLLVTLAQELGIDMQINQVDMPDMWGQDSSNGGFVFYRHVNAVLDLGHRKQIFDLALPDYREGFPQRFISQRQAAALLFSNIGVQKMYNEEWNAALHYLKLSVAIFPRNADMWINLGAAYKNIGRLEAAETVYLQAISISDKNSLAASNLERLYRQQGDLTKAEYYKKLTTRARQRNPYFHYRQAEQALANEQYALAQKSIGRAIKLHKTDPIFYALRSRIKQASFEYVDALKDLEKAYSLSNTESERANYLDKVTLLAARAKEFFAANASR